LPSTPLKETELRADRWREIWGHEQTEIDALAALQPALLREIAENAIAPFYDFTLRSRAEQAASQWRQKAQTALDEHPDYQAVCDEVDEALEDLEAAIDRLHQVQQQGRERLAHIKWAQTTLVEPAITVAAPRPLFTTADDFMIATTRLIEHKKLLNGEGEAS
jgi:hypothetical protein